MTLRLKAPAKINLVLEVLGKRPDGFHQLASVVHGVGLYDELEIRAAARLTVRFDGAEIHPNDDLITRAAERLGQNGSLERGAEIVCRKRIPLASGLGGGSSNAAATLIGLRRLWATRTTETEMGRLAAELGSDVPMFLAHGAALIQGRGDLVTLLPPLRRRWAVIVLGAARFANKTALLFARLSPADFSDGARAALVVRAMSHGELPQDDLLVNAFEPAARATYPGLAEMQDGLSARSGTRFHLSGAGPTLFALCADRQMAVSVQASISDLTTQALVVPLVASRPRLTRHANCERDE